MEISVVTLRGKTFQVGKHIVFKNEEGIEVFGRVASIHLMSGTLLKDYELITEAGNSVRASKVIQ